MIRLKFGLNLTINEVPLEKVLDRSVIIEMD